MFVCAASETCHRPDVVGADFRRRRPADKNVGFFVRQVCGRYGKIYRFETSDAAFAPASQETTNVETMRAYWSLAQKLKDRLKTPPAALAERRRDRAGPPAADPGADRVIAESIDWLCRAQDFSASADGGVARDFSLINGWATSYPETTGYIIPTLIDYGDRTGRKDVLDRARRMLDWLVRIQLPDGAFQGGRIDSKPVVPVTFNTGQILLGLAAGEARFGAYRAAMERAADWLVKTQDPDGCWRKYPSPFAGLGEKAYETHVAWGLFEAARLERARGYEQAAIANVQWMLRLQRENGWLDSCCLDDPVRPLTHTIGYALRGVLEAYRATQDPVFLEGARLTGDGALSALRSDGFLPGRLRADWTPAVDWSCLTGAAQIAHCWLLLGAYTKDARYIDAANRANRFVRRTVNVDGAPETRGAVKGSFPVDGEYARYEYPNWGAKFLIDSLLLESDLRSGAGHGATARGVPIEAPAHTGSHVSSVQDPPARVQGLAEGAAR